MAKIAPGVIFYGIKDDSGRVLTPTPEQIPDCLPHQYFLAERGDGKARIAVGNALQSIYGTFTFDTSSPYYTHGTGMLKTMAPNCAVMTQRVIPSGAKKAMLRLSCEVCPASIPKYARTADGSIQYTGTGPTATPTPDPTDPVVNGYRVVWHLDLTPYVSPANQFGKGTIVDTYRLGSIVSTLGSDTLGTYLDPAGVPDPTPVVGNSTLYPILDLELDSEGQFGNRVGLRFQSPTTTDTAPLNVAAVEALKSMLYRFSIVERDPNALTTTTQQTVLGEDTIDLSFVENSLHPVTKKRISFEDNIISRYTLNTPGFIAEPAPFAQVHVYHTNLETVLERLTQGEEIGGVDIFGEAAYDAEAADFGRDLPFADPANMNLLNIFSGTDTSGKPYFSFDVTKSIGFGGIAMGQDAVLYASGGTDGLTLKTNGAPDRKAIAQEYDALVRHEWVNYGLLSTNNMLDMARFPVRGYWDSGFSLTTKEAMFRVMASRPDVYVVIATQSVYDWVGPESDPTNFTLMPPNSEADDQAIALALKSAASLYPESTVYGTPVCRALIVGQCGNLLTENTEPLVPMTFDLAHKVTRYMGASSWITGRAFDQESLKMVELLGNVNNTWKTPAGYNQAWTNGMIYVQFYDRDQLFYPAYQTVYDDDTSVLDSAITMMCATSLQRVHFDIWKQMTPTGALTDEQLKDKSDRLIAAAVKDKYDGRFVIRGETFLTAANEADGRSWSSNIHLYANNDRTIQYSSVITHRMSDLATGP